MRSYLIAIISGCVFSATAFAFDSDNDKVLDNFDLNPQKKSAFFAKNTITVSQLSGFYSDISVAGRYRFGDDILITGTQFEKLIAPVVVVYQHNNVFNFKPTSISSEGLVFKLDVPKGKYALFIYDQDQKTNEVKVESLLNNAPLIFGDASVTLEKGKPFSLSGIGFNQDSKVVLGPLKITPKFVSNTRLTFEVPNNAAGLQFYIENNALKSNIIRVTSYK